MLSQASGYAATALALVAAAQGRPVLVKNLASTADIPLSYLAKIVHSLSRKGLVITQRGIGGGVTLARAPASISLMDICVALNDPVTELRCLLGSNACTSERACPAHEYWIAQRDQLLNFLRTTSIADLAAFEARRRQTAMPQSTSVNLSVFHQPVAHAMSNGSPTSAAARSASA